MKRHLRIFIYGLLIFLGSIAIGFYSQEDISLYINRHGVDPVDYLVKKVQEHKLLLIGTYHKNPLIHNIIISALPVLVREAKIDTIFVEIPTDQQDTINSFMEESAPVYAIRMWEGIACPTYLNILLVARNLGLNIIAIDQSLGIAGSRDTWMVQEILSYYALHPDTKGLVVAGERHVLKGIKWSHTIEPSLADLLGVSGAFSVVMWPDAIDGHCPKALDIEPRLFSGVKDAALMSMNIKPQVGLASAADGVILLPASIIRSPKG
ncbi:MAG: hypothetical protein U9P49_07840 [Thermodesulfobacteriota bacterium]|nr:hypothetical protein [Thermodesulfobacteriota bacterium]